MVAPLSFRINYMAIISTDYLCCLSLKAAWRFCKVVPLLFCNIQSHATVCLSFYSTYLHNIFVDITNQIGLSL